jgi:hypothetical protein
MDIRKRESIPRVYPDKRGDIIPISPQIGIVSPYFGEK